MLDVGMKVLIIGASTTHGQKYIGCEAQVHQVLKRGEIVDPGVLSVGATLAYTRCGGNSAVIYREGLISHSSDFKQNFAMFKSEHLMPIPPLADPGIDECTFTPIVQKEHA